MEAKSQQHKKGSFTDPFLVKLQICQKQCIQESLTYTHILKNGILVFQV